MDPPQGWQATTDVAQVSLAPNETKTGVPCPKCQAVNATGAKFCSSCGNVFAGTKKCPSCGKDVQVTTKFCDECGAKI